MRRPVYDRSLASTKSTHSKCKQRRPALKRHSTSKAGRPKQKRPAASNKATAKTAAKQTIGIDLGDQNSAYCVLDAEGDVLSEGTLRTVENGFAQQFQGMSTYRIAIETGTHSLWVSRLLQSYGHEVIVANARQLRVIYESDRKNDKGGCENAGADRQGSAPSHPPPK
jgi:Transposase